MGPKNVKLSYKNGWQVRRITIDPYMELWKDDVLIDSFHTQEFQSFLKFLESAYSGKVDE